MFIWGNNTNLSKRAGAMLLLSFSLTPALFAKTLSTPKSPAKAPKTTQSVATSADGYSLLVNSEGEKKSSVEEQPRASSDSVKAEGEDPDSAMQKAKKIMSELVNRADNNIETSVAATPEDSKNGSFNADDRISSLSSITYHTNNEALCVQGENGKPDGARCKEWLDKDVSEHGKAAGDSSPLERKVYELWEGAKKKIGEGAYRIWNVALREGEKIVDEHGRLNIQGLSKYELNEEATKAASELGTKSAEQALRIVLGDDAPKGNEVQSPPPEVLRALAVNVTKSIANSAVSKWAGIQAAKKGIEVVTNAEMDSRKYKAEVEKKDNEASTEERLLKQAPLDVETNLSLEDRIAKAESVKKANSGMVNPTFDGDKLVNGDPSKERYDEWAYRATREQLSNPFMTVDQIQKPKDVQLSQRQVAAEIETIAGDDSEGGAQKVVTKQITPKEQIEDYNRQLEIAARSMEVISAESSTFVNTADKIRSHKLGPGESILTINDLTPAQKQDLNSAPTPLVQNPSPKVIIPASASQLTITNY